MANGNNHVTPPDVERELERRDYYKFREPPPDPVVDDHHVVIPLPDPIPIPVPDDHEPVSDDRDHHVVIPLPDPFPVPIPDDGGEIPRVHDWIHEPLPLPVPLPDSRRDLIAGVIYAALCMFVHEDQILLPYH